MTRLVATTACVGVCLAVWPRPAAAQKQLFIQGLEQLTRVRIDHYWLVQGRGDGVVARLGRNFQVTDCDILAKGDGLVPGQYSSGGKQRLGRITKAGDPYLRMLLILGARSVLQSAKDNGPARGVPVYFQEKAPSLSRLTIEAPARVFHQGPQSRFDCIDDPL